VGQSVGATRECSSGWRRGGNDATLGGGNRALSFSRARSIQHRSAAIQKERAIERVSQNGMPDWGGDGREC
jgi:hypothetical protein